MSTIQKNTIRQIIDSYYTGTIQAHGATPRGVDWKDDSSHALRFKQLLSVISEPDLPFSLNDYGCGYGALYDYLREHHYDVTYHGFDLSAAMIKQAEKHLTLSPQCAVSVGLEPEQQADYSVASGIFNVRQHINDEEWLAHIYKVLENMSRFSNKAFAFNCLSEYSDADYRKDYLYYCNPCAIFDYCKQQISPNVALLHDYGLYECTIIVRS
ncbi:MAG: class I SAM-dependent methyltransferase [Rickettsiales bacterium]|nr:class I SAM-dependent methyltransferase [Rickettsiales bacterium]